MKIFEKLALTTSWAGRKPSSVTDRNIFGDSPLHTVCTWGDVESARILIGEGADVNAKGDLGSRPLFNAVISGNIALIRLLIENGADVRLTNDTEQDSIDYATLTRASKAVLDCLRNGKKAAKK